MLFSNLLKWNSSGKDSNTSNTLDGWKTFNWTNCAGFPISITLFSNLLKYIPTLLWDDFDDEICYLKAKSLVDNVKCYIIAILYDVQCFSLKNFIPDGPAAISFLIAKIGLHQKLCVRLLRSPPNRPVNPHLDLYIKQAHHCISLYWMGSIFTSALGQFQIFFWFQKIKRTDCRTHYATIEGRVVK